jgi:hypothetical protein
MVFARGLMGPWLLATDPFRIFAADVAVLLALSRRFRGRDEGVVVIWSFCW